MIACAPFLRYTVRVKKNTAAADEKRRLREGGRAGLDKQPVVYMHGITKRFGDVFANRDVSLQVHEGEILSLLGENGSGKSTLMNMLSGIYFPDSGTIEIKGNPVTIRTPEDALRLGIGMVHQHFKLVEVFTALENILLGMKKTESVRQSGKRVQEICDRYGFEISLNQKVYDMSVSQKQTLEIVKVLFHGAEILILDEPTAVLTPQETERLFSVMRNMKEDGKAIIIITHKLNEVLAISDRVAILRKGEYVGDVLTKNATEASLTEMMVGRKVSLNIDRPLVKDQELRLQVRNLSVSDKYGIKKLQDINFDLYSGEMLGVAGISGSGQKELLEAIAGLQSVDSGSAVFFPEGTDERDELIGMNPRKIREKGIHLSFVPEDRLGMGLVGTMGMTGNMLLRNYREGKSPFFNLKKAREQAQEVKDALDVSTASLSMPVRKMSGGNLQKVLVGREIANAPSVLMTAYAVRGLDINSSMRIYQLLNEQKEHGVAILSVWEDLDTMLELCDRILVLCGGRVSGILDGRTATKQQVGLLMTNLGSGAGTDPDAAAEVNAAAGAGADAAEKKISETSGHASSGMQETPEGGEHA